MKILFFGIYNPLYARNRVISRGFEENGCDVTYCNIDPGKNKGISKYIKLWKLAKEYKDTDIDYVVVAFPGHSVMWLAKILFPRKKIIFDAFLSLFDSNVYDRKLYGSHSLGGIKDYFLDW